jgi:hypothetical protein
MNFIYNGFRGLRKACMGILPFGVVLTIALYLQSANSSQKYYGATVGFYAISVIFLVILPVLIVLTRVPDKTGDSLSLRPSTAEKLAVGFAKIVGGAILLYLVLAVFIILGMAI